MYALCFQDKEVMEAILPVFSRTPAIEHEATLMRPRNADRMVLTVDPPKKCLEPDSPSSIDQLIAPQSPDYDTQVLKRRPQLGAASSASLEDLLQPDERAALNAAGVAPRKKCPPNIFNYDSMLHRRSEVPQASGVDVGVLPHLYKQSSLDSAPCVVTVLPTHPEASHEGSLDSTADDYSVAGTVEADSGQSSLANLSDSATSHTSKPSTSSSTGALSSISHSNDRSIGGALGMQHGSIIRNRPSPKKPVTHSSSQLSLEKSPGSHLSTDAAAAASPAAHCEEHGDVWSNPSTFPRREKEIRDGSKDMHVYENTTLNASTRSGQGGKSGSHNNHHNGNVHSDINSHESQGDSGVVVDLNHHPSEREHGNTWL